MARYPLRLDSLDMNNLPISYLRDFMNSVPSWNFGFDSNDYFEFEVRDTVDSSTENSTVACYICAIGVPKLFYNVHINSKRHYINKSIAETALDRMKKHLHNEGDYETTHDISDKYYCNECGVVVPRKDQKSHENLSSHKHLVMFDTLYENFYKIYVNESGKQRQVEVSNTSFKNNTYEDRTCDEYNDLNSSITSYGSIIQLNDYMENIISNTYSVTDEGLDCNSSDIQKLDSREEGVNAESKPKPKLISSPSKTSMNEADCTNCNDEKLYCNVCYNTLTIDTNERHICDVRHKINSILEEHYMLKESGNQLFCSVCCTFLENSIESAEQHCKEAYHIKKYSSILKENGITATSTQFFCKLCNKNIPYRNEVSHILLCKKHQKKKSLHTFCNVCHKLVLSSEVNNHDNSELHKAKLESKRNSFLNGKQKTITTNVETTNNKTNVNPKPKIHFCNTYQCQVENNAQGICKYNLRAYLSLLKKLKTSMDTYEEIPSTKEGEKNNILMCKVCNIRLPNSKMNVSQHGKAKVHLKNYYLALRSENIVHYNKKLFCLPCNEHILSPMNHIKEADHINKHALYIKDLPIEIGLDKNPKKGTLEQTDTTSDENSSVSGVKTSEPLLGQYLLFYKESPAKVQEPDCVQSDLVSEQNTFGHTITVGMLDKSSEKNQSKEPNTEISRTSKNVKYDLKLLKSEWITKLNGHDYCKICGIYLQNVQEHIEGSMHQYLHPKFPY